MWNLLSCAGIQTIYRPASFGGSGSIWNAGNAIDDDNYPWSTNAYNTYTGSNTDGTTDNKDISFLNFPTLAKANMSSIVLSTVVDYSLYPAWVAGASGYFISCFYRIEYSLNGGSTWIIMTTIGCSYTKGSVVYSPDYPASDISAAGLTGGTNATAVKTQIDTIIDPSLLTTGLQDLRIRFTLSTLTSVRSGNPKSAAGHKIWDIRANVS